MSYDEAVKKLQAKGSEIQWGGDFGNTDETLLTDDLDRPVMVDRYPTEVKAFYFEQDPQRPEVALGVDVIAPEGFGEVVGGGQRVYNLDLLLKRLEEHGLPPEAFDWYVDLRKYGGVPHAGFGMGVERFVAWMCGLEHIRETIAFPRMLYRTPPVKKHGIAIIGAPMDLGAGRRGVDMGPSAVRLANVNEKLSGLGYNVEDLGNISVVQPESVPQGQEKARYLNEISRTCETLAAMVEKTARLRQVPAGSGRRSFDRCWKPYPASRVIITSGTRRSASSGLTPHADMNTPETSPSGNIHGMPLACCIGLGPKELSNIYGFMPKVAPENVAIVGLRSVDSDERRNVQRTGVRAYTMRDVDERGLRAVMQEAIEVATNGTAGFHLSFDMDSVDPHEAPGVGTPVKGGFTYREAHLAMEIICDSDAMVGLEVVEVNPVIDEANRTAIFSVELVMSSLGKRIL